jgi:predicted transcriptional regulator
MARPLWQNDNMDNISDDLNRRMDALAARTSLTRSQMIEAALSQGRSLACQEKWIAGVHAGIEAADRGEFASEEAIARVFNKFGQA